MVYPVQQQTEKEEEFAESKDSSVYGSPEGIREEYILRLDSDSMHLSAASLEGASAETGSQDLPNFCGFSSDEEETASLAAVSVNPVDPVDTILAENLTYMKNILNQLARLSTLLRRSGTKYRHKDADKLLDENRYLFSDLEAHLTFKILIYDFRNETNNASQGHVVENLDTLSGLNRLTTVQRRLIKDNVVRRNRIYVAEKKRAPKKRIKTETAQQARIHEAKSLSEPREIPQTAMAQQKFAPKTSGITNTSWVTEQTRTATQIGSELSFGPLGNWHEPTPSAVTEGTQVGFVLEYPSLPHFNHDDRLQCPYCGEDLPDDYSKNKSRWRGHVARDILPYSCYLECCEIETEFFLTSEDLERHLLDQHGRTFWVCDYCAAADTGDTHTPVIGPYGREDEWRDHMRLVHTDNLTESELPSLSELSQKVMLFGEALSCPLCSYKADSPSTIADKHIIQHLHDFALGCLPRVGYDHSGNPVLEDGSDAEFSIETEYQMDESTADPGIDSEVLDIDLSFPDLGHDDILNALKDLTAELGSLDRLNALKHIRLAIMGLHGMLLDQEERLELENLSEAEPSLDHQSFFEQSRTEVWKICEILSRLVDNYELRSLPAEAVWEFEALLGWHVDKAGSSVKNVGTRRSSSLVVDAGRLNDSISQWAASTALSYAAPARERCLEWLKSSRPDRSGTPKVLSPRRQT